MDANQNSSLRDGWTPMLLFIYISVTIGAVLPIGFSLGVVNQPAEFIFHWSNKTIKERYDKNLSRDQIIVLTSSFIAIFLIGGAIGSMCSSECAKKCGRKGTLIIAGIIYIIGGLFQFFCRLAASVELLLAGRFVSGIAAGLVLTAQPMYFVELAPAAVSDNVGVFTCIGITGGVVVGQIFSFDFSLGTEKYWHCAISSFLLFVVLGYMGIFVFPESPRYIYAKSQNSEKTRAALKRLGRKAENINAELEQIEASENRSTTQISLKELISTKKYSMPLLIICTFHAIQQFSGINAIFYYSIPLFTSAGFSIGTATWLNFALGVENFILATCNIIFMKYVERRTLMLSACMFCAVWLVGLTIYLCFINERSEMAWACLVCLILYIIAFNLAISSLPFFIGLEIFEDAPRPWAMSIGCLCNWLSNFTIGLIFPIVLSKIKYYAFLPCALACIYAFLLTYFYLPETFGRKPQDVAPIMANGFKSNVRTLKCKSNTETV